MDQLGHERLPSISREWRVCGAPSWFQGKFLIFKDFTVSYKGTAHGEEKKKLILTESRNGNYSKLFCTNVKKNVASSLVIVTT